MLKKNRLQKLAVVAMLSIGVIGCSQQVEDTNKSTAEDEAVPMSAKPADSQDAPIVEGDTPEITDDTATTATAEAQPNEADGEEIVEEGGEDNSEMDNISENDQVVDDEPASPDAPTASEEPAEVQLEETTN